MSYKPVRTIGDASRHGLWLEIICKGEGCDRVRKVPAGVLMTAGRFTAGVTLAAVGERMRCRGKDLEGGGCGHRGAIVRAIFQPTPDDEPPGGGGGVVLPFPVERRAPGVPIREAGEPRRRRARR